jgi:hypothetical protein
MTRTGLAILILAMTATAPAARGETAPSQASLFTYFKTICGPDVDPARTAARAQAQGFAPAKKKQKLGAMEDVRGFEKTVDGREFFVLAATGKGKPRNGLPASTTLACGVGLKGKDEAAVAAGRRWVGVPATRTVMGVTFHAFRQSGSGRAPLDFDDKAALAAALAASDFNVLTISGLGGVTLLVLSRSREAT